MTHQLKLNNCAGCMRKRSLLSRCPTYVLPNTVVKVEWQEDLLSVAEEKQRNVFHFACTSTPFMTPLAAFCALDLLFATSVSSIQPRTEKAPSVSIRIFFISFYETWPLTIVWSPRTMTVFISCSPRMTVTFASLGPDCLFSCNRILDEDFL